MPYLRIRPIDPVLEKHPFSVEFFKYKSLSSDKILAAYTLPFRNRSGSEVGQITGSVLMRIQVPEKGTFVQFYAQVVTGVAGVLMHPTTWQRFGMPEDVSGLDMDVILGTEDKPHAEATSPGHMFKHVTHGFEIPTRILQYPYSHDPEDVPCVIGANVIMPYFNFEGPWICGIGKKNKYITKSCIEWNQGEKVY